MAGSTFISFAAQTQTQVRNLSGLRFDLLDLQRQVGTGKKTDNFSGLGVDRLTVLEMRTESRHHDRYASTIDRISIKAEIMNNSLLEATEIAREVKQGVLLQTREGEVDLGDLKTIASSNMDFFQELLNTKHNGNFVFSGDDLKNQPFLNDTTLTTNMQTEITDWLAGGQTTATLLADINNFSGTNLGYNASLGSAGQIHAKVDDSIDVDYTVKADNSGFQKVMRGMALLENLEFPDPMTDVATEADFHEVLDAIVSVISEGVDELESTNFNLSSKINFMDNVKQRHVTDKNILTNIFTEKEEVDMAEAIAKLQTVQNQLTASYEVARVVNSLNLVNFI